MKTDPMKDILKSFDAMKAFQYQDPMKDILKSFDAMKAFQYQDPMKDILKSFDAMKALQYQDPMKDILKSLEALKAFQYQALEYPDFEGKLVVNSDYSVTLNSTTLSYVEIQQIANEIAEKTFNQESQQLEQVMTRLLFEIRALKSPAIEKILYFFIYPIIVGIVLSIINPVSDYYVKNSLSTEDRVIVKKIKKNVFEGAISSGELNSYRLVTTKVLVIRSNPSSKSPTLGRLYFGQVVMLIEKRKDWSLVAWSDHENSLAVQGWVFSRYLSKFN